MVNSKYVSVKYISDEFFVLCCVSNRILLQQHIEAHNSGPPLSKLLNYISDEVEAASD